MSDDLLGYYRDRILTDYEYLDFRGIMQRRVVELPLDDLFVPLEAKQWGDAARPEAEVWRLLTHLLRSGGPNA